jgi:uncharacterized protein (DUF983 family)
MPVTRPTVPLMFRRALLLQCAWCGDRPGFRRGWFRRYDSCQHCGLSVQRGHDGFELGAATMNVMIMLATLVVAGGVSVVITYPDVAVTPLMVVLGIVALVLPVVLYPFSYTIWFATELLMDPPSDEWLARATETILQIPASNA